MSFLARTCSALSHRLPMARVPSLIGSIRLSHEGHGDGKKTTESWDDYEKRYIGFFKDPNLDSWWIRKRLQEMHGEDAVPDPKVATEVLRACRRLNDLGLAIRFLEATHFKCGNRANAIWPWYMQQLKPVLDELGVPTLEELGYNKPELACVDVDSIH